MRWKHPLACLIVALCCHVSQVHGQTVATWTDGNGNWSNPANWSTNPAIPNNTSSTAYNVLINNANSTVTVDVNATINRLTLGSSDTLVEQTGSVTLTGAGSSKNSGTIYNLSLFTSDGSFANYGSFYTFASGALSNTGTLTNSGNISVTDASFYSTGTLINTQAGTISINSDGPGTIFDNTGGKLINFGNIQAISQTDPGIYFATGNLLNTKTGVIDIGATGAIAGINNGQISAGCPGNVNGYCYLKLSNFTNNGTFSSTYAIPSMAGCNVAGNCETVYSGKIVNNGAFFADAASGSGSIVNHGNFTQGTLTYTGTILNSGALIASALSTNSYTQLSGSTTVGTLSIADSSGADIQGGTFAGTTVNGNLRMGGTLVPNGAPGTLTILGNYQQTSSGILDEFIGPLGHSLFNVNGSAKLDSGSMLQISLLNGYNPLGQTFEVMDFSGLSGEFANGAGFWDGNYFWEVSYTKSQIDVTAIPSAPEPSALLLLIIGLCVVALCARSKPA